MGVILDNFFFRNLPSPKRIHGSWLAGLYAVSVSGRAAFGPNAGRRVTRTGDQIDPESMYALASPRCATLSGFSLHANVAVPAGDRPRLERLCRLWRALHNLQSLSK